MSIETPWANDAVGGTKLNATRLLAYTPLRGSFTNPNGNVIGSPGNVYLSTTGGVGTTLWVKETGVGTNTGWGVPGSGGGSGTVTSVAATDATITVTGSASAPTIGVNAIPESKVTNLTADLAAKADLTSGRVPVAELGTGTADGTTFLRGDRTWTIPAGGGSSPVTTKGDLIVGNGSGTPVRLPVSSIDGQVLTAAGGQTNGLQWAGVTGHTVFDEGSSLTQRGVLNFVGTAVTVTDDPTGALSGGFPSTKVTIPGGGGSSGPVTFAARLATTSINGTVTSGLQAVDTVAAANGNVVFYKDSSTPSFNGLYAVNSGGGWGRDATMPAGMVVPVGSLVSVAEGGVNGGRVFQLTSTTPGVTTVTVGTNAFTINAVNVPPGYATPAPNVVNGQPIYLLGSSGNYFVNITVANTIVSIADGIGNAESVVNVAIQMDSTGGKRYDFSPSSIAWGNGYTPSNDGRPTQFDLTAGMMTLIRLTWMGAANGWYAEVITSIPPLYFSPPTSLSITNTTTAWGSVNPQNLNLGVYFMRYVPVTSRQFYYNALTQCYSAALRQRLLNNNGVLEVGAQYPTDNVRAGAYRGGSEPNVGFFVGTALGYTAAVMQGGTQAAASGACVHEINHMIDALYYGGANPHPAAGIGNGSEPDQISSHSTLQTLHTDCVNNGASPPTGAQSPANQYEWFSELWRSMRLGDNGAIDGSITIAGGAPNSVEWQTGYGTNLGPGGTGGTPAQRLTRFQNYINSLGLV